MMKISEFYSCCALVNLLIFSSQSIKYVWYSPQNSKYPLFPNLLEVVNYRVLISHQPLIPVQDLSWLSVGLKSDIGERREANPRSIFSPIRNDNSPVSRSQSWIWFCLLGAKRIIFLIQERYSRRKKCTQSH